MAVAGEEVLQLKHCKGEALNFTHNNRTGNISVGAEALLLAFRAEALSSVMNHS